MNNTKSNNIIESLNERRYVTYTFSTDSEATEFCRDNHINTGEIEFDGEYYTVELKDDRQNKPRKHMTEYEVSFTLISNHSQGAVSGRNKETVKAYSDKQARTYLEKVYRKRGYTLRDFKVTGERVIDSAGFVKESKGTVMSSNINSIIEGLDSRRNNINESMKTSFMPKIKKFLGDVDKDEIDFVEKVINTLYSKVEKEYGSFFESKSTTVKKGKGFKGDYKYITWKIQLNSKSDEADKTGIIKDFDRFLSGFKSIPFSCEYGNGTHFRGVSKEFDNEDDFDDYHRKNNIPPERFEPEDYVFVGIDRMFFSDVKLKRDCDGAVFQFVVARPVNKDGK